MRSGSTGASMSSKKFDQSREGARLQSTNGNLSSRLIAAFATAAALAFGLRATIDLFGEVRYWSPETPVEYAAVALTSLALLLLGGTLWAMGRAWKGSKTKTGLMAKFSGFSINVAATAAVVVAVSNFLEDYLRMRWFGTTFVAGGLVLILALLTATVALFAATPPKETAEAVLLLAITVGVASLAFLFVASAALLAAAAYHGWGRPKSRNRPDLAGT
jgi:hypothetical protein